MTALTALADFIAGGGAADAAQRHRESIGLHIADTVAAWCAGAATPEGRRLIALDAAAAAGGGSKKSDALGRAVALNVALARLSEIDDIHISTMTTPGSVVVTAALGIAAGMANEERQKIAAAIIAGYEAMTRLGASIDGPHVLYRGIWPTLVAAPLGVAAVAASLQGLDAARTAHALALALERTVPGISSDDDKAIARWLAAGRNARRGYEAASEAAAGAAGNSGAIEHGSLTPVLGCTPDAAVFTAELGSRVMMDGLSFKPWCAARQTMPAVEAVRQVIAEGAQPGAIERVEALVVPAHLKMVDHGVTPGDRGSYLTSLPYQIALAVHDPEALHDVARAPGPLSAGIEALMARVKVSAGEAFGADYPKRWMAEVAVTTRDGSRLVRKVDAVPGDPTRAWGEVEVSQKLLRYATPLLGAQRARAALTAALGIMEGRATVGEIIGHLEAARQAAVATRTAT